MRLFQTLLDKLRSGTASDDEIEQLDRRAFMVGMAVTGAGLAVAPRVFLPPRLDAYSATITIGGLEVGDSVAVFYQDGTEIGSRIARSCSESFPVKFQEETTVVVRSFGILPFKTYQEFGSKMNVTAIRTPDRLIT